MIKIITTLFWVNFGLQYISFAQNITPSQVAQKQLDAYNQKNLEAFLQPYSDSVKIFNFPKQLLYQGKEQMRVVYGNMFKKTPDLHCTLINRTNLGNIVVDKEYVVFDKQKPAVEVIAIYKINNEKITEVYFIRNN